MYQAIANMMLEDDEEAELAAQARGTNYILPPWMQGANIVAIDMDENGVIRFANMDSANDVVTEIFSFINNSTFDTTINNTLSVEGILEERCGTSENIYSELFVLHKIY